MVPAFRYLLNREFSARLRGDAGRHKSAETLRCRDASILCLAYIIMLKMTLEH